MRVGTSTVQDVLKEIQFPARKEQIIEQARKQNAPDEVIKDLQKLPDQVYESVDSLMGSIQKGIGGISEEVSGVVGSGRWRRETGCIRNNRFSSGSKHQYRFIEKYTVSSHKRKNYRILKRTESFQ